VAGNLQVDLDARGLPIGPVSDLNNGGVAGGVFESVTNGGLGPQVVSLGGNGTHGILFDGNSMLVHLTSAGSGNPQYAPAVLTGLTPSASVEAWVFAPTLIDDNPIVSWGTRGSCGGQVSFAYGANGTWGGIAMWCNDHGWGVGGTPAAGTWHHLAWTLDGTGSNEVLYADGAVAASYSNVAPNIDPNNNIAIAFSHANTAGSTSGGVTAGVIIARVRVHDGILTGSQVLNNYNYERATFTNGTPSFLAYKPMHRWSFTNAATNDAVGLTVSDTGTNGVLTNAVVQGIYGGATASFTGTQLILGGGSSQTAPYVDLADGLLTSLGTNVGGSGKVTFEIWAAPQGTHNWARLFDFGSNTLGEISAPGGSFSGIGYVAMVATPNGDLNNSAFGYADGNLWFKSRLTGAMNHVAVTWDDTTGYVTVYENGVQVTSLITTNRIANLNDINNWLGRSNWSGDENMQGGIAEFRLFNRLLSAREVLNDYQVGPTVVDAVLKWNGNVSGNWDINTTANWLNGFTSVKYNDGGTVQFDDTLTGTPNVNVTTTVQPGSLTINNTASNYVFGGSGKISGSVGLTKSGTGSLSLGGPGLNDYTGATLLNNGTLIVTNLANGGTASGIGASSSAAASLTLGGGTFSYRGPATSINRAYLVTGNSTLDTQGDLNFSGLINSSGGTFTKTGAGKLTYSGAGYNKLTTAGDYLIGAGTVVFDGTAGQSNAIGGQIYVGFNQTSGASAILNNTSVTNTSWTAIGRGNGTGGYTSSMTLSNSTLASVNFSLGYANGIAGNNQTCNFNLYGNSRFINTGTTPGSNLGENGGSTVNISLNDTSWVYSAGRILIGMQSGSTGTVVIANSATLTNSGYVSMGAPGCATVTLKNNAIWQALTDFNVTDTAGSATFPSVGVLNIQDNALLRISTLYVGKSAYCYGTINQTGGTVLRSGGGDWRIGGNSSSVANQFGAWNFSGGTITCAANFQIGAYGNGTFNQSGGVANFPSGYPDVGRFAGAIGYLNISGGSFNQLGSGNLMLCGEAGTGTINMSGTGVMTVYNLLGLGWAAGGNGTLNMTNGTIYATNGVVVGNNASATAAVNLYGGTLATKHVYTTAGSGSISFAGGTLLAMPGANVPFLGGLSSAIVYAGGATIDTGTNATSIAQDLTDGGQGGGFTKLGTGTLTMSGNLYYTGPTVVSSGKLYFTSGMGLSTSSATIANSAGFGVVSSAANSQVVLTTLTMGSGGATTLDYNLGDITLAGNPTVAPLYAGPLAVNGPVTVNLTATGLQIGEFPLVQYSSRSGSGSFVLGTLPPGVVATIVTNVPNSTIDLNIAAINLLRWTGVVPGQAWDINNSANWTNLLTGLSAKFVQGSSVIFDDSASTNLVNLNTNVAPTAMTFSNSALNYTIAGTGLISGASAPVIFGTGSVTLGTRSNTYTGVTAITGGTLIAGTNSAFSPNSITAITNGVLDLTSFNQSAGAVTATNATIRGIGATLTAPSYNLQNAAVSVTLAGNGGLTTAGDPVNVDTVLGGNTFTGPAVMGGGTLFATNLANGGLVSSIGASSADPTNFVFTGGTLSYQGSAATINRGYLVAGGGELDLAGNLTLTANPAASGGVFVKGGPATLDYVATGSNVLSAGINPGYRVGAGNVTFDGSAGSQTNYAAGELWVGYNTNSAAFLTVSNTSLGVASWIAIDRGNGTSGFGSSADFWSSLVTCGNLSMGYDNGIVGNSSFPKLSLHGSSTLRDAAVLYVGESGGSQAQMNLADTSAAVVQGFVAVGLNMSSVPATGAVTVANSASFTVTNNVSVGRSGVGTLTMKNSSTWLSTGDMNVADLAGSDGTLNIQDTATMTIGALYVGKALPSVGVVNQTGGSLIRLQGGDWRIAGGTNGDSTTLGTFNLSGGSVVIGGANLQVGAYGQGVWNQTAGAVTVGLFPSFGRYAGAVGEVDISGGTFTQTNTSAFLIVGEAGNGTLNISNTALVTAVGGVSIGHAAGGTGILNLNGGTLSVTRVFQGDPGGASGTFNFNGGLLQARTGSYPGFMGGLSSAYVLSGGAKVDSGAGVITISQDLQDGGGGGGLTKTGSGTLILSGNDTYTGLTLINNGALHVDGTLAGGVQVNSGTLGGVGTINGPVTVGPAGTLSPGDSLGRLTNNNTMTLSGSTLMEISRSAGVLTSDEVVGLTSVTYGGTLAVANIGPDPLQVGDTFQLFSSAAYAGSFSSVTFPSPYIWTTRLAIDGTIAVTGLGVSTTPPHLTNVLSGNALNLSWPADHIGWRLVAQTNPVSVGLRTNWATVPGSTTTNRVVLPISTANGSVFVRLVYP
jgi:autotransporter-associated beta strand protein/T5SS/PEP-CTERM-associated repeat protein